MTADVGSAPPRRAVWSAALDAAQARPLAAFAVLAAFVTLARVVHLLVSPVELGVDEAQYWVWSRTPDWGYFSKPPLIAWAIAATTAAFGQAEWAVRLASPFFHAGAAGFLAAAAARLYDARAGFYVGAAWLTLPSVALSSLVMSTDAPLLFFWAAALFFFFRLTENAPPRRRLQDAALLGAALGLGLLAKYAMIYFVVGAALAAVLSRDARRALRPSSFVVALAVAAAFVAPNLLWNARHHFATLAHTAANADWERSRFDATNLFAFLGAQAGVVGPVFFGLLVRGLATLKRRLAAETRGKDLALLAFAAPPLAIVAAQAFVSRAHANWAATAYPAALILVVVWAIRRQRKGWLRAGLAVNAIAAIAFMAATANFAVVDAAGLSAAVKRVRGWDGQAEAIARAGRGYDAVLVDDREIMSALLYYGRPAGRIVALDSNRRPENHYEATMAYDPARDRRVLFVTKYADPRGADSYYEHVSQVGAIDADIGRGERRRLYLYAASSPKPAP